MPVVIPVTEEPARVVAYEIPTRGYYHIEPEVVLFVSAPTATLSCI